MLLEIPLKAIANQSLTVPLNGQNITIDILSRSGRLYINVFLGSDLIIAGMGGVHGAYINQYPTNPKLIGYLFFWDDSGIDPTFETLTTTSHLLYSDYDYLANAYKNWEVDNNV